MITLPRLSVIVPVYNVERYINWCLASLCGQTYSDFDIICVNDGSTDGSLELLREWEKTDSRISIIDKPNGGLSSARNAGIDAAKTEYVCFLDSDDRFHPETCEQIVSIFDRTNADVLTFGATCYPPSESYPWLDDVLSPRDCEYTCFSGDILFKEKSRPFAWRTACKTSFLNRYQIRFDESVRFGEDQVFDFAIYPRSSKTVFSSLKLYDYRVSREGSLMHKMNLDTNAKLHEHVKIVDAVLSDWNKGDLLKPYENILFDWIVEFVVFDALKLSKEECNSVLNALHQVLDEYWSLSDIVKANCSRMAKSPLALCFSRFLRLDFLRLKIARSYCTYRYGEEAAHREFDSK